MIFYFSGTGNSLYAAKRISEYLGESLINISSVEHEGVLPEISASETIGLVFPIYAWSAPKMVFDSIKRIDINGHYLFAVGTYGQNVGRFDKFFEQEGIHLNSAFTLNMPNNYLMIWDRAKQERCLAAADTRIETICDAVYKRKSLIDIQCVLNGMPVPEYRVAFASEMNAKWSSTLSDMSDFYVTDDCVGCGTCEKVCNGRSIKLTNGKPIWGEGCTKCLACLHLCPKQAIQFGEYTLGSGRYKNPNIKLSELMINK